MTTYKEIQGTSIQSFASDPPNPTDGQVWYNSTEGIFKVADFQNIGVWSAGGSLNFISGDQAMAGIQTAALSAGGDAPSSPTPNVLTEEYDGSTWTVSPATLNTARNTLKGAGTQTSALAFGGRDTIPAFTGATEEYNGSVWTTSGSMSTARNNFVGAGTQTAALAVGGPPTPVPDTVLATTEEYDGSTWTSAPLALMSESYGGRGSCGTQTAALAVAGDTPSQSQVEGYDGSTWSSLSNYPAPNYDPGAMGIFTSALAFGGRNFNPLTPQQNTSNEWNGVAWIAQATMANPRSNRPRGAAANGLSGIVTGSNTITEEWNAEATTITDIVTSS